MSTRLPAPLPDNDILAIADRRADACEGIGLGLSREEGDDYIDAAIAIVEGQLAPAGNAQAERVLSLCLDVLHAKRPAPQTIQVYVALLSELPADLLQQAIKAGLSGQTHHLLPTPGAFLAPVLPILRERREKLRRLQRHKSRLGLLARREFCRSLWS